MTYGHELFYVYKSKVVFQFKDMQYLTMYAPVKILHTKKVPKMHGSFGQNTLSNYMFTNDVRLCIVLCIQNKGVISNEIYVA